MSTKTCRLIHADAIEGLRRLPDGSVHCVVTSPPYFGLRDYGEAGQIGLEATPEEYVARLVEVFREARRALAKGGTLWLNLGDSYCNAGSSRNGEGLDGNRRGGATGPNGEVGYKKRDNRRAWQDVGIKHKDLIGAPWMAAFALRADGWWLRQSIIWHKPSPMTENVQDRCTTAHEFVFLLAKSKHYHCDMAAIQTPGNERPHPIGGKYDPRRTAGPMDRGGNSQFQQRDRVFGIQGRANRRSVWTIASEGYGGAHFATMPESLAELCVLAGCPEGGTVLDPFVGSGTVCAVALRLGRSAVGIDLNREYLNLARKRCEEAATGESLFHPTSICIEEAARGQT